MITEWAGNIQIQNSVAYYDSGDKRMERLATTDAAGFIYYEYMDEDFSGRGCGRIEERISSLLSDDGVVADKYRYTNSSNVDIGALGVYEYVNDMGTQNSGISSSEYTIGINGPVYYDCSSHGLGAYFSDMMIKLSAWNLCTTYLLFMIDGNILFDFGVNGLYKYDNGYLIQISPYSPYFKNTTVDVIYEYDADGNLVSFTVL